MYWLQYIILIHLIGLPSKILKPNRISCPNNCWIFRNNNNRLFLLNFLLLLIGLIKNTRFFIVLFHKFLVLYLIDIRTDWSFVMLDDSFEVLIMFLHLLMMASALVRCPCLNNIRHNFKNLLCSKDIGGVTFSAAWIRICLCEIPRK